MEKHEVKVHIDRKPYLSPNPTTRAALYALGNIPDGYVLYMEMEGHQEDREIERNEEKIALKENQHFYHQNPEEKEVTIQIDRHDYKSPNPTTGAALYILGKVQSGYELFLEVHGDQEDKEIANTQKRILLKNDQHFYTAQTALNPGK